VPLTEPFWALAATERHSANNTVRKCFILFLEITKDGLMKKAVNAVTAFGR
jgi:hypothetical protein